MIAGRAALLLALTLTLTTTNIDARMIRWELNDKDEATAAELVRKQGARAVGKAKVRVSNVTRAMPFMFSIDFEDGTQETVLALDGKVIAGRDDRAVGRYLEVLRFLEKRDLPLERLVSVLSSWGKPPSPLRELNPWTAGPTEADKAELHFDEPGQGGGARLIVYDRQLPPATRPGSGHPGGPSLLRVTVRIDAKYQLRWTVERWSPKGWQR